ncbi:uncharacterized protein LOC109707140 [Ananas comosus]|uniref:Uncharacterized protein LOC109707140 n=1 Tax=Ananas comosus TaxID=4615 RepID=A0A6P5ERL5_ANACO|nr:uncharacterized protein LOC109707140 [Ananas comosus]
MKGGRGGEKEKGEMKGGGGNHKEGHEGYPMASFVFHRRLMIYLILPISALYVFYTLNLLLSSSSTASVPSPPCPTLDYNSVSSVARILSSNLSSAPAPPPPPAAAAAAAATGLEHIVFGIAASADLWDKRKEYIKVWWRPGRMRGFVWLDRPVREFRSNASRLGLPILKLSADTSKFPYTHRQGSRSALRISRIVSETFRLGLPDVRWFVMGDDDTVFVAENLVRVLGGFDHRQPYYIGSLSESHLQNIYFSYGMAYGGGGFAISRPLAAALARVQDGCIARYPALYGSDDRIQACMAELGVPLTRHPGFHQYDVYGDLLGLLAAHPVAPLVSLHHLDVVQPVFPGAASRAAAVRRLFEGPVRLDAAGVMQQSICYDRERRWTVSVSWGFAVQVVRGVMSPREMEMPARTFLNWYRRADYTAYAFNTRPVARNPCQRPHVYYLAAARLDPARRTTLTRYDRHRPDAPHPLCRWKIADPAALLHRVLVYKKPDPALWDRSPRRNCCRVLSSPKEGRKGDKTMTIDVGVCREGEISLI